MVKKWNSQINQKLLIRTFRFEMYISTLTPETRKAEEIFKYSNQKQTLAMKNEKKLI